MNDQTNAFQPREWRKDALGRKPLADHLTLSLMAQARFHSDANKRGLTVALDADWGAGKTFFVKEWIEDLKEQKHPVIYFDAWENDIGDEASIALMAAVLGGLERWKSEIPTRTSIHREAAAIRRRSIAKLRRALVPAAGIVFKGVVKKAIGVGIDEVVDAFADDNSSEAPADTNSTVEATLDKLFEEALSEHESRKDALVSFKQELGSLLLLITENTSAEAPLFVFIDELDRCRPSYAVKLLEEIKHVFGVENVVYVVSTNIDQLQNSVRALYGSDFDGRRYLHRLFDREYTLPAPDNRKFANAVVRDGSALVARAVASGLPKRQGSDNTLHDSWSAISDAFGLDFRTQKQTFELAEEAATGISPNLRIHALWLFFLCALRYRHRSLLDRIVDREVSSGEFKEIVSKMFKTDVELSFRRPGGRGQYGHEEATSRISEALTVYFEASAMSARDLFHKDVNSYDYPNSLYQEVVAEYGGVLHGNASPPSIRLYPRLVQTAGFVIS